MWNVLITVYKWHWSKLSGCQDLFKLSPPAVFDLLCCVLPHRSVQRNGSLFGNHINHVSGDQQGSSQPTTVTQRPLQILTFSCSSSTEPTQTGRRAGSIDREGETEMNSSPIQYNHHYHPPHPHNSPHCNSTRNQSPIPSNANLNNANVPSLLSMTSVRQQKSLLKRELPSSTKNGSSASAHSKGAHDKTVKSHSTRSVDQFSVWPLVTMLFNLLSLETMKTSVT